MKILIPVDGSACTRRVLNYLAAHDDWLGARHDYTVLHCVAAVPHRAAAFLDAERIRACYEDDADVVFKPIRAFFASRSLEARFVFRVGPAAATIAKLANRGRFDLLLMGSHGRGRAAGLVMGSVATKVLALCATPVLLIR